jgi:hypothetical protein
MPPAERELLLLGAIAQTHAWHYPRNVAYRRTVSARGVGETITPDDLPRVLRPTAQTFKSYIDLLGTPFPQDCPHEFLAWLAEQISIPLPAERGARLRRRYGSLEALLSAIERLYADLRLELSTSSGTSGRSSIMARDDDSTAKTVESFYLAFQRYMGMKADHRTLFIMPRHTRITMARMAAFSVKRVGLSDDRIHFAIPFPAYPDQVRVRAGRTYRTGWRGWQERELLHPSMNWMNDHYVTPQAIATAVRLLERAEADGEKVLLFAGWAHLHGVVLSLRARGHTLRLAPGSIIGSGGGLKERYAVAPAQIRRDIASVVLLADGGPAPIRDTYGMSEGNWAAMQCSQGNYHVPPWVYAVTLDDNGQFQRQTDATGLLAFYDPFAGGRLFPSFFRTADRVRLVNGAGGVDPTLTCPCGDEGAYIVQDSIRRVDLLDEAGCAASV